MKNEDRIVELLAELVEKQDVFADKLDAVVGELKQVNQRLERVEGRLVDVDGRIVDVEKQMAKNNAGLNEVRLSVMRLADKLDKQDELEKRLIVLEKIVLK